LISRADLPVELANSMCAWVSDALKIHIANNYKITIGRVDTALAEAVDTLGHAAPGPQDPPADSAQKLIDKLAASGQLKAGFLMRVLSQGQVDLFDLAFSRLLHIDVTRFRQAFYAQGVTQVALACRAAGIDKSVFATVFNLSRQARAEVPTLGRADMEEADLVFGRFTRAAALEEMQSARVH